MRIIKITLEMHSSFFSACHCIIHVAIVTIFTIAILKHQLQLIIQCPRSKDGLSEITQVMIFLWLSMNQWQEQTPCNESF